MVVKRGVDVEAVFSYFFAIGSGLMLGVAVVVLPGLWIIKKISNRGGTKNV